MILLAVVVPLVVVSGLAGWRARGPGPAAVWSAQDLAAARSVLVLPAAEVRTIVVGDWDRRTDRRTGTDEFLAELGVAAHGPYDEVVARSGQGC